MSTDRGETASRSVTCPADAPAGVPVVVSGPSGAGKTSILHRLMQRDPSLRFSVSHTTRAPRPHERRGEDYFFVTQPEFAKLIEAGSFLEWAEYQGHLYGTSEAAVREQLDGGFDVLIEVDVQGFRQLRDRMPGAVSVIVLPPSFDTLGERLRTRASDSEAAIEKRLEIAREEIRAAREYGYVVINDDLDRAVQDLERIVAVARMRPERVMPGWWARSRTD